MTTLDQALRAAETARKIFYAKAAVGVDQDAHGFFLLATPLSPSLVGTGHRAISHVDGVRLKVADQEGT